MAVKEVNFKSSNERDTVQGWIYTPLVPPKAIIQIVHGIAEHSRRYLHMILTMLDAGFIVCADDSIGHGKTASVSNTWGDFGDKGYMTTTIDERTLRNIVTEQFPELPFFLFGHSWGSFIARNYAAHYGEELSALILCGSVEGKGKVDFEKVLPPMNELIESGKGPERLPEVMNLTRNSNDSYVERYPDMLSNDPNIRNDYIKDPFNSLQCPTVQFLYDVAVLNTSVSGEQWALKVPKDLPIYNIAGDHDPNADFGEGTYRLSNLLYETGHINVKTKVYSGYCHEIHNEPDIRDEVEAGIIKFIEDILKTGK